MNYETPQFSLWLDKMVQRYCYSRILRPEIRMKPNRDTNWFYHNQAGFDFCSLGLDDSTIVRVGVSPDNDVWSLRLLLANPEFTKHIKTIKFL